MSEAMSKFLLLIMSMFFSGCSLFVGFFLSKKPSGAIELQRKFYERINWRMEPISVDRELKNTKAMGLFMIAVGALTVIYVISARPF